MPNTSRLALAILTFAVIVAGCSPVIRSGRPDPIPRRALVVEDEELSECLRPRGPDVRAREQLDETKPAVELPDLPEELRRVVEAAGVESLLAALMHEPTDDTRDGTAVNLQLVMQLSSLEIEVASLLFATLCHGAQMDATARELDRRRQARNVGLTVASILVGAATATAGGIWETQATGSVGPPALLIGGGIASATLGVAAFVPDRRPVVFMHPRNLLTPIWTGEDPDHLYPSFVFRMLMIPDGGATIRAEILEDWKELLDDAIPERERVLAETLLFGEGGIYDQRLLELRERMFDTLESHVHGIDQELERLYRYSANLIASQRGTVGP